MARHPRIATDHVHLGRRGVIEPGEEVPATYLDSLDQEQETDFDRLSEIGAVEQAKPAAKSEGEKPAPRKRSKPAAK